MPTRPRTPSSLPCIWTRKFHKEAFLRYPHKREFLKLELSLKSKIGVITLFLLLTFIQLLPLSLHPADALFDRYDCLLNTWIISWVQSQIFSDPLKMFDANIFYPAKNTLSFSEHLFPQAMISLPLRLISGNPVLVYNFVFFLSHFLNAWGMFLLVCYLTKNSLAGLACGVMFAFNSYLMNHIAHLQLLSSGLIPLTFLYLHKFLEDKRIRNAILFSLFFSLQALACIYYGLFMISILTVGLPLAILISRRPIRFSCLTKLVLPMSVAGAVLAVFALPYFAFARTFGLDRGAQEGAEFLHYLAAFDGNVFLKSLSKLGRHEHWLFPGILALFFAGLAAIRQSAIFRRPPKALRISFLALISLGVALMAARLIGGAWSWRLGFASVSFSNPAKLLLYIIVPSVLYVAISLFGYLWREKQPRSREAGIFVLYLTLSLWALLLSFGTKVSFLGHSTGVFPMPFQFFRNYFPGFKGIREPSRYAIFVIFSLVVLAGYGIKLLSSRWRTREIQVVMGAALILFLNLEYLSLPKAMETIPTGRDIPPTYHWLKAKTGRPAVLELPFFPDVGDETGYMLFSIFHKKNIVNGYSGFWPPVYEFGFRDQFENFPSGECLDILKAVKIQYVVLHLKMWDEETAERRVRRIREQFRDDLRLVQDFTYSFKNPTDLAEFFGHDQIYEVVQEEDGPAKREAGTYREIPVSEWSVRACQNEGFVGLLRDNDLETIWSADTPKGDGQFLWVEFLQPTDVTKVSLLLGPFTGGFAKDIDVETSADGRRWEHLDSVYHPGEFVRDLARSPQGLGQNIYPLKDKVRHLKIIQIGYDDSLPWQVAEMKIYTK